MKRRLEIALYGFLAALLIAVYGDFSPGHAPRRPQPYSPTPIPAPEPGMIDVELAEKTRPVMGTAFLIARPGIWVTAAHVSDGCDALQIRTDGGDIVAVRESIAVAGHDLALLKTGDIALAPLAMAQMAAAAGSDGFHIGFPGNKPGEAASQKLGAMRMRTRGVVNRIERVDVWAEQFRNPDSLSSLGGLSGGPVLDAAGRVQGVNSASSVRRGRIFTIPQPDLAAALSGLGPAPGEPDLPPDGPALTAGNLTSTANGLRAAKRIAPVYCLVAPKQRRPGRL